MNRSLGQAHSYCVAIAESVPGTGVLKGVGIEMEMMLR